MFFKSYLNNYLFKIIIFFEFFLAIYSCSPIKSSKTALTGKIILENESDFSGVKVYLFALPQIDTSILNPLKKYTFLFPYDLHLFFFDFRYQKPLAQALTDKEGNFSFSNIPDGDYILFIQKEGFGWDYFKISTRSKMPDLYLKKEIRVSGSLQGNNIWNPGNYIIEEDIEIPAEASLRILPGSIIRFKGNYRLKVSGMLTVEMGSIFQKPVIFTSDDTSYFGGGISILSNGNGKLDFVVVKSANIGVYVQSGNLTISRSVFISNKNYGVSAVQIGLNNKVDITNCIFVNQPIGINLEFTDTTTSIRNSIFVLNMESGIHSITSRAKVENNFFYGNKHSISGYSNAREKLLKIYRNSFAASSHYHIYLIGQGSEIKYNDINSTSGGILLGNYSNSIVNYNNLLGAKYLIKLGIHTTNVDAKFNYWGTISEAEIRNLIFDKNDVLASDPFYIYYGIVDYSSYFDKPIKESGVR